jgi:hypothetical protein
VSRWSVVGLLLIAAVGAGCGPPQDHPSDGVALVGRAVAGPTCPVVTEPPDPSCEDRPVAGAKIVVRDEAGEMVATAETAEDGTFSVSVAAGRYQLVPQPVEGLLGTAAPVEVVVPDEGMPEPVIIFYDTGIR